MTAGPSPVTSHAKLKQERITLVLAQRELSSLFQERRTISVNSDSILHSVCSAYNIEKSGIIGRSRATKFSLPRQIAMYLMKEYTDLSNKQIGGCLGNRDHSTVIHGHAKIKERLETDLALQQSITLIKRDLEIRT